MEGDGPRTIAVVEDDDAIRQLVETVLRGGGYRVVGTGDPTTAVELIRREAPDLVLCDIAMPVMDGYTVLRTLQADPETARYPVVFLTAHREFTERVQAFRFGVVDYVTKPFTREMLLRKVEKVLRGLQARPGHVAGGGAGAAAALLDGVRREARTGVLSVTGDAGPARVVIRAGEVVEGTDAVVPEGAAGAEFHELDPDREQIVAHDPASLPGGTAGVPDFGAFPQHLRTVLIVDDNRVFRKFLRELLAAQGFTVHEATSGEEGLSAALEHRPWLILTDVKMPGGDGFELCRRVRGHSLIHHTPLIFLSGWDDYKERYRGLEAGGDEYLSKDTPVRELLIRIHLILKRYAELGSPARTGGGIKGALDVMGAPGFLQMCHLGRLTGLCTVRSGAYVFSARFREGEIVGAGLGGRSGVEAIFEFLGWSRGYFEFVPGDPGAGTPLAETFDQIVLEGCRRLDEHRRAEPAADPRG